MVYKIFCLLLSLIVSKNEAAKESYQLIFPLDAPSPYAQLFGTIPSHMMDLTMCYWVRPQTSSGCDVIFSYAVPKAWSNIKTSICSGGEQGYFQRQATNGYLSSTMSPGFNVQTDKVLLGKQSLQKFSWLHSCITWSSLEGRWQFYLNGYKYNEGTGLTIGEVVQPHGVVVLGQDQDVDESEHDVKDQMRGQISELNLWDSILTPDEVIQLATCNLSYEGNVIGWKAATWELYDGVRIAPVKLPCVKPRYPTNK